MTKALEIKPNDADTLADVGALCAVQGDAARALECLQKSVKIDPTCIGTHLNLFVQLQHMGQQAKAWEVIVAIGSRVPAEQVPELLLAVHAIGHEVVPAHVLRLLKGVRGMAQVWGE